MADANALTAFDALGLGSVLKRWRLVVQPNQREYAWTDKQVRQMFQDFSKAITEDKPHFLGTIATIPKAETTLEVVDGQQRLATTALLLAAIRDYLNGVNEPDIAQSVNDEFLSSFDRSRRIRLPKLSLNTDDNDLFSQLIGAETPAKPTRQSHELILEALAEARKHVKRIVATLEQKDHGEILNRWIAFIEHKAWVVLLRVSGGEDAFKMFETLNDRGLKTTQADLIKSYLFSKAGERIAEVQARWSYMRGALESFSDAPEITIDFLRHALIVQRGHLVAADVYDRVQEMVRAEGAAVSFAASLESLAQTYVATANPEHERWNQYPAGVRRAIEVFNLFGIKPLKPLILAVAAKMEKKQAAAAFDFLVSLGVRLVIASSTRSGSVEEPLAKAAQDVFAGTLPNVASLKAALIDTTPTDVEFREAVAVCRVSRSELARYYLRSLEMSAKKEPSPWYVPQGDPQIINLEHVLPTKPEGNWPQFQDDEVGLLSNRLGNLALMRATTNSDLRSRPFAEKRPFYADSPYELTRQIAEAEDWTRKTITDRQVELAKLAVKTWPA